MLEMTCQLYQKYSFFCDNIFNMITYDDLMPFHIINCEIEYINICRRWMKTAFTSYRYQINRAHKKFRIKLYHMLLPKKICYDIRSIIISYVI